MKFSLNHDVVGTRTYGSFNTPEEWEETSDDNAGEYWAEKAGMTLCEWKAQARVGDKYYVATSVYLARVE
jgi:hypothetical protein